MIVRAPKITHPKCLSDVWSVALMSLFMKALEKAVKVELLGVTQGMLDPN